MREITKIIVHCTATPEGREVDVEEIRKWHVEERGWSDVGYHFTAGVITEYTGNKLEFPIGTAFMVGFGKESLDYIQYGTFDTKDLLATTLGGFAVSLTIKLLDNEKNNNLIKSYRKHKRKQSRKKRKLGKKHI